MKPYRTSLLADAVPGSVRTPAPGLAVGDPAYTAHTHSRGSTEAPAASQSTALRERLSQTRARIARAHAQRPPQINVDWDPEEPPTRLYKGESLSLPRASQLNPARAHTGPRPSHARARAEAVATARIQVPTAARTSSHAPRRPAYVQPTPTQSQMAPQPEVATPTARVPWLRHRYGALRTRIHQLYVGIDRSDATLRRRVAFCSFALLAIAAMSRMLFAGHVDSSELAATDPSRVGSSNAQQTPVLRNASVAISSDPPGALLFVNGQPSNLVTPAKLHDLAPGRYTISLKLAGYAETKEALHVPADALVSIKLASLTEPRFAPEQAEQRALSRAEMRAQARELARERRIAARAAKVLLRYRARMGLPPDPVAQELVDAYGPTPSPEP